MIVSATTEIYNGVFLQHYDYLLKWAYGDEDNLLRSYEKVRKRIDKGYTAHTHTILRTKLKEYNKTTIKNWRLTEYAKKKLLVEIDWEAEDQLCLIENNERLEEQELNQMRYETQKLFEYLKKNYREDWQYVFRCYYLYDAKGKKITYAKLSKITGFSISKCCGIIQTIKTDLRNNLKQYIENGNQS